MVEFGTLGYASGDEIIGTFEGTIEPDEAIDDDDFSIELRDGSFACVVP